MRAIAPPAGNDKDTVPQHRCSDFRAAVKRKKPRQPGGQRGN